MKSSQSGQTIIEAIVALMTILLILTAISIVIVNGLYNSRYIKNQNEANKYAQEGIEFIRNLQKNDKIAFSAYNNDLVCIDESTTPPTLTSNGCTIQGANIDGTAYNRTIVLTAGVTPCNVNEIKVEVTVTWSSSKCTNATFCHKSQLFSCMPFNYPASNP